MSHTTGSSGMTRQPVAKCPCESLAKTRKKSPSERVGFPQAQTSNREVSAEHSLQAQSLHRRPPRAAASVPDALSTIVGMENQCLMGGGVPAFFMRA